MPDAFESLRIGRNAMTPSADFAGRLLGRIREELGKTTTTTVRDLYYATLAVRGDVERATRFFRELFGWEPIEPNVQNGHTYVNLRTSTVAMVINDDLDTPHVWFHAPDLDEAMAAVARAGGRAELHESGDYAVCVDDQGAAFGLSRPNHGAVVPLGEIPAGNIGYVTMNVPDEARGRRFYGEVLGWRFDGGLSNPGFTTVPLGLATGVEPGHWLFVKVDDAAAMAERVRALGGTAGTLDESPSGINVECADDQGTQFFLWQPAPGY